MSSHGPRHHFVVAARHLQHHLLVHAFGEALDHADGILNLLLGPQVVLQDHVGSLSPQHLENVPHLLDRVQLAALRGQELMLEIVIENHLNEFRVVHAEVVHDNNATVTDTLLLELGDEGMEGVGVVAAREG